MGMADIGQNRLHYAIARCLPELVAPRHRPLLARTGRTAPLPAAGQNQSHCATIRSHGSPRGGTVCLPENPPPLYLCLRSYPSAKPGAVPARLPPDAASPDAMT